MTPEEKIQKIKNQGIQNLCIISDFDDTISIGLKKDGSMGSNSFSVYCNNPELLGKEYIIETNKLFEKYNSIDKDMNISNKEKIKSSIEWYKLEFELYKKYKYSKTTINTIIENNLMKLKKQTLDFFQLINKNKIETIIFSAGLYNLIHEFLKSKHVDHKYIHVVANKFIFDKNNYFQKIEGKIFHSLNKTFPELSHLSIYDDLKNKQTCMILGDSISDTNMTEGSNFKTTLKIGFINKQKSDKNYNSILKEFQNHFDIILEGTEDFTKINQILKQIIN